MNKYLYIIAGFLLGIGCTASAANIASGVIPYGSGTSADWGLLSNTNGGGVMSWDYSTKLPIVVSTTSLNMIGAGTVTSITAGSGLSGGAITTSGTVSLSSIAANSVLGTQGSSTVPFAIATSSLFQTASASLSGLLSSTDWTTFNGKQASLGSMTGLVASNGTITYQAATTSETCSSGVSCAAHAVLLGGGAITLSTIANGNLLGNNTTNASAPFAIATSSLGLQFSTILGTVSDAQLASTFLKTMTFGWEWTNVASGFGTTTAIMGIGTTTPVANFQATTATANATTSVSFGKKGQNKGTCITMYNDKGVASYIHMVGTTLTVTATKLAGCQD